MKPMNALNVFGVAQKIILLSFFFVLPACDLYEESWVTPNRMQVEQDRFYETYDLAGFSDAQVAGIARHYARYGGDGLSVSVTYDPHARDFTAMNASHEVGHVSQAFKDQGVQDAQVDALPVSAAPRKVIVSYGTYHAKGPEGCDESIPGLSGREGLGRGEGYKLGCSLETLMARQVARPRDLLGNDQVPDTTDGRRVVNAGEAYRDGVPNEPFEDAQSASGDE